MIQMIVSFDKIIVRTKGIAHRTLFDAKCAFLIQGAKAARQSALSALKYRSGMAWFGTKLSISGKLVAAASHQNPTPSFRQTVLAT